MQRKCSKNTKCNAVQTLYFPYVVIHMPGPRILFELDLFGVQDCKQTMTGILSPVRVLVCRLDTGGWQTVPARPSADVLQSAWVVVVWLSRLARRHHTRSNESLQATRRISRTLRPLGQPPVSVKSTKFVLGTSSFHTVQSHSGQTAWTTLTQAGSIPHGTAQTPGLTLDSMGQWLRNGLCTPCFYMCRGVFGTLFASFLLGLPTNPRFVIFTQRA